VCSSDLVFLAGALIGMFTITGIAGSYTRMVMKVARFNQLRNEKEALKTRYTTLEKVAQEKDLQVASLGSLAGEVSALYGLKTEPVFKVTAKKGLDDEEFARSIDQLYALKTSALTGAATIGIEFGPNHNATTADWLKLAAAPTLWPVAGLVTGSFGERIDPFNGEGAFHTGVDISTSYGTPVIAPADGIVTYAETLAGYGRLVMIEHGQGISTRYGHLANYTVAAGQSVHRGDIIGYVGMTGRATGPHLHYEVRIHDVPVNPHKYLRMTIAQGMEMAPAGF